MFGMFGGNSPRYQGIEGAQAARPSSGFFGVLAGLFGGNPALVYKQSSPEPTSVAPIDEERPEPAGKPLTVIVVLDARALAEAILHELEDPTC